MPTTSRQTNRFSRVPSRPPLLLTPRLEATCGTKVSRVVASKSSRPPFRRRVAKSPRRRVLQAAAFVFQRFQRSPTKPLATKNRQVGGRAVGATNRTLPRRNAVERSNLRPFGIKGYFGSHRRQNAANAFASVDAKQSASRDNRGDARAVRRSKRSTSERSQTVEATPIDANCGTARRTTVESQVALAFAAARPDAGLDNKVPCLQVGLALR